MDANEIERLANLGAALRPDWARRSLKTFIERNLAGRTYADTAVAIAWVCTRTKTDTPRLLLEAGPWWRASMTETDATPRPPKRAEACATCGRPEWAHDSGWVDHAWTDLDTATEGRSNRANLARAQLASTRSVLCRHGVQAANCREDHPTESAEETA